jgi:hypothetical protein
MNRTFSIARMLVLAALGLSLSACRSEPERIQPPPDSPSLDVLSEELFAPITDRAGDLARAGDIDGALQLADQALKNNPRVLEKIKPVLQRTDSTSTELMKRGQYGVAITLTREKLALLDRVRSRLIEQNSMDASEVVTFSVLRLEHIESVRSDMVEPLLELSEGMIKQAKFKNKVKWWEYIMVPWVIGRWIYEWGDSEEGQKRALCLLNMTGQLMLWMSESQRERFHSSIESLKNEAGSSWDSWKESADAATRSRMAGREP